MESLGILVVLTMCILDYKIYNYTVKIDLT